MTLPCLHSGREFRVAKRPTTRAACSLQSVGQWPPNVLLVPLPKSHVEQIVLAAYSSFPGMSNEVVGGKWARHVHRDIYAVDVGARKMRKKTSRRRVEGIESALQNQGHSRVSRWRYFLALMTHQYQTRVGVDSNGCAGCPSSKMSERFVSVVWERVQALP